MKHFTNELFLNIAGYNVCINFHKTEWGFVRNFFYKQLSKYLANFLIPSRPNRIDYYLDFVWEKGIKTLYFNKEKICYLNFFKKKNKNKIVSYYRISIYEFQRLLYLVLFDLTKYNTKGMLVHASSVIKNGHAYLFLGKSGTGKTTIIRLLKNKYEAISDDVIILKKGNGMLYAYQTPFFEKSRWINKNRQKYQVGKIIFIKQSNTYQVFKIKKTEIVLELFSQQINIFNGYEHKIRQQLLEFIKLCNNFYLLNFGKDKEKLEELIRNI
ncbi:ATP-binding cassette domain-containing protein [Candidatus Gottesmanbacteria bacterium]|nr:ATP-binding cassette domain-containing protein [Candidatus Gottesmanbacteria bacterium]